MVEKGGLIRDEALQKKIVSDLAAFFSDEGLSVCGSEQVENLKPPNIQTATCRYYGRLLPLRLKPYAIFSLFVTTAKPFIVCLKER